MCSFVYDVFTQAKAMLKRAEVIKSHLEVSLVQLCGKSTHWVVYFKLSFHQCFESPPSNSVCNQHTLYLFPFLITVCRRQMVLIRQLVVIAKMGIRTSIQSPLQARQGREKQVSIVLFSVSWRIAVHERKLICASWVEYHSLLASLSHHLCMNSCNATSHCGKSPTITTWRHLSGNHLGPIPWLGHEDLVLLVLVVFVLWCNSVKSYLIWQDDAWARKAKWPLGDRRNLPI